MNVKPLANSVLSQQRVSVLTQGPWKPHSISAPMGSDNDANVDRLVNRMAQVLELIPAGVIVLNGQGMVQQANAVALGMLGEPLHDQAWVTIIDRAFAPKSDNSADVTLQNGRIVHISTCPLSEEPGQIILLNDITETRRLQLKVSHLQRLSAMGEMAAKLAHQIRTPLASAVLYLAPLMKTNTEPRIRQKFAKKLQDSMSHMERLIKDMLAFSRGDMASAAPVAIETLCEAVAQQFRSQHDAEQYDFQIENALGSAFVFGSQDALASAINNLLNNACYACEARGEITLFIDQVEDSEGYEWIEICVEDNGVGIKPADQDKIMTPFFTTYSSGTGLGLPVVKSIVKAHRGEVWFASDYGEGSTFCIRLPRYIDSKTSSTNQFKESF